MAAGLSRQRPHRRSLRICFSPAGQHRLRPRWGPDEKRIEYLRCESGVFVLACL